jgi:hypothetical protein
MVGASNELVILDRVHRRVMFALELVDPGTGRLVSDGLRVTAAGLSPPQVTLSGRFVWRDIDPPAARRIKLTVESVRRIFQPLAFEVDVPEHRPNVPSGDLVQSKTLQATGLYEPPPGLLAVAGMLVDDVVARQPLPGVEVRVQLHADSGIFATAYKAITDARGGFVAAVPDLGSAALLAPPCPAPEGGIVGWLTFTNAQAVVRHSPLLAGLRKGRLLRAGAPFAWADLLPAAPPMSARRNPDQPLRGDEQ